jgi:hypothetical protein
MYLLVEMRPIRVLVTQTLQGRLSPWAPAITASIISAACIVTRSDSRVVVALATQQRLSPAPPWGLFFWSIWCGCQFAPNARKVKDVHNPPDLMILRNDLLEIETIEQLPLVPIEPTCHRPDLAKSSKDDRDEAARRSWRGNRSS